MHIPLLALFLFAILTLWVPAGWPVTVFQVGIFALAGIVIWQARSSPPPFTWPLVPLSFAVLWGLIQCLTGYTAYTFETSFAILKWVTFLAVFLIGTTIFRDEALNWWARSAMVWFAFLVSILATLQSFTAEGKVFWLFPSQYTDYVMGSFLSRNDFAAFIEAVLPMALYRAVRNERDSLLYAFMAAVMYASVIASASRAGTVLTTAEIVLVPLLLWGRRGASGRAAVFLRLALLVPIIAAVVGVGSVRDRFFTPDPLAVRRELAASSWHMATAHPWWGVGLGCWSTVYPGYATVDVGAFVNQAHNDWLQWIAEGGFPFALMIATLFFWSLRQAFRTVWGLGAAAVFLHALVDYPFARPALGSWPILVLSLMVLLPARRRTPPERADKGATGDFFV